MSSELVSRRVLSGAAIGLCLAMLPAAAAATSDAGTPALTVSPELGSMLLTWSIVPQPVLRRLVIRFRIDGPAPSSPQDGSPFIDIPATPGTPIYFARHGNLSATSNYAYAAFGLDEAGDVRAQATAIGRPLAAGIPGTVQNLRRDQ